MTPDALAADTRYAQQLESRVRAYWDGLAAAADPAEYSSAMSVVRAAGALRKSLETWIVTRATRGTHTGAQHG